MTIDLCRTEGRDEVRVPLPGGETMRVDPREHREDVVRRLLQLGVADTTLATLLPDWAPLIERLSVELSRR